ncbi:MAG: NAD(P)-dependent oxidoreductase [Verrucomicrobiales bacterium]|nr:NAD(P)-dependent oxidoreductase [Verrucomicrobiales bacterium]
MTKKVLIPTKLDSTAREFLENHGGYSVHQEEEADLLELAKDHSDAHAFIVRSEKVSPEVIDAYPDLKVIVRAGAGFNTIDINYARSKGIDVMNTPGANSNAVAEEVLAMMMAYSRHLIPADSSCRSGKWEKSNFMGSEITGKTLGILGLGHIGQLLVKRASGFDMKVIAFDPILSTDRAAELGVELVKDHLDVFKRADFISLHIPENDHTRGMINEEVFAAMKDGAVLINCARSGVVDEDALRAAKKTKKIGFLNDVYTKDEAGEKSVADIADIMLPHLGASTREANYNAAQFAAKQLVALDEKGVGSAIVNRDIPVGLDPSYYELAHTLTKFCRQGFGKNSQLKMVQTFCYGDLKKFAEWLVVPIVCALDDGFNRSLDHHAAVDRLTSRGIEYTAGDADDRKGYGNSITIDLFAHGDNDQTLHKASIRGTVTEGNLMISRINDFDRLYVVPEGNFVCFIYEDRPGVLAKISSSLAEAGINIDDVRNPHSDCGKRSLALLKVNQEVSPQVVADIKGNIDASVAFHVKL